MAISLEEVQALAEQLAPSDQAQLIARLVVRLAPPPPAKPRSDAWERLKVLREELRALGPNRPLLSEQLEADRAGRDAAVMGRVDDVHT